MINLSVVYETQQGSTMIKIETSFLLVRTVLTGALCLACSGYAVAGVPAPAPLAPANGASVQVPFTLSWSAVSDPSGIAGYNWQVSPSAGFSPIVLQNSTNGATQDIASGLASGKYFWRVQAVNGAFEQGAWSSASSFTVTGAGPNSPAAPTLSPTKGYSTFHPREIITFNWTQVPNVSTYTLEYSTDPSFPVSVTGKFDNIPNPTMSFGLGDEGNYYARVLAVTADRISSVPSNVITFSVFFNNPLPQPPSPISPGNGTTLSLPVTLTWSDVPNPQPSGYEIEIAKDSGFRTIEEDDPQLNDPSRTVLSLTPGTKFWRVRSAQGDASPTTAALTAWSSAGTFTIPSTPPTPASLTLTSNPLFSGNKSFVAVQLSAGVSASGATIGLTSSNPSALPVPATINMPPNTAWTQFQVQAGQVTTTTPVTLTATLDSGSASVNVNVLPPSLKSLTISPSSISGGAQPQVIIMLNGQAPPEGAVVTLSSNSPAVTPLASATIAAGSPSVSFSVPTSQVTANTTATITATWNGVNVQGQVTLLPQEAPASITLSPTSTTGSNGSFATVRVISASSSDETLQVTSSNPSVASTPNGVTIPAGATAGGFSIFTTPVSVTTVVTISVSGGGVTRSADLTLTPTAAPASLASISLSPATVTGGASSQGVVTLTSAAPSGGLAVALSSSNAAATVPASITVPAGATSAAFTVATSSVTASTVVTITASAGGTTQSAALTVNAGAQGAVLTVTATGRSREFVSSSPAGINVAVGSTQSASFTVGTSITLSASDGRDTIWSGACSSGGRKVKTCTFTLNGNASVTANVQ